MYGSQFIDNLMYDLGKIQVLNDDTNYRTIARHWFNRTLKDISSRCAHWRWLEKTATFNTVADQMSYDRPTDMDTTRVFTIKQKNSPTYLRYIDQRRFDQLEPEPDTSSGEPFVYTLWSDYIRLYPVPDEDDIVMYVRYIKTVAELLDDNTTAVDLPAKYDEVLLDGAKVLAYNYEPGWGNAQAQRAIYETGLARMVSDNNITIDDDGITESHGFGDKVIKEPYSYDNTSVGS